MCSTPGTSKNENFDDFYTEVRKLTIFFVFYLLTGSSIVVLLNVWLLSILIQVKQIEKRDAVLTSDQQINRLLRPGSTYFNLNPFEVLQLEPDVTVQEIKKKYRSLSILCHPDKNQDNKEQGLCFGFKKEFQGTKAKWK